MMKKALIEPSGRVAETVTPENTFPIAEPLIWMDCADEVGTDYTYDGDDFIPPTVGAPTKVDVAEERDRRLALGFSYDFGDGRGVHEIGTAKNDMQAWGDEVTPLALALNGVGDTSTTIGVVTETGPVEITGPEWLAILLAAGVVRQPIWAAYFTVKNLDPIPADYDNNNRWPL